MNSIRFSTSIFAAALLAATAAQAECDKLSIVDAKALTQEQLKGRICRDMTKRNAYVDSANEFLEHRDIVFEMQGNKYVSSNHAAYYYGWLGQLKQAATCNDAVKSNTETYGDLYANASPGCDEPHVAGRLEMLR